MKKLAHLAALALLGAAVARPAAAQKIWDPAQHLPDIAAETAADYRMRAQFPDWCVPVAPGQPDPLKAKRQPQPVALPAEDGSSLAVWASDIRYEAGDTAVFYARLDAVETADEDAPAVPPQRLERRGWQVTAEVTHPDRGTMLRFKLHDDGVGVDEKRGDGIYSGSFRLPRGAAPALGTAENYMVLVTARQGRGRAIKGLGGFLFSNPAARLTGRYRDYLEDGDLVIAAEARVLKAGRFHLSGSVHDARGRPLAIAQTAEELAPGTYWIRLRFYGAALRASGVSGPYWVDSLSLTTTGSIPNALGPMVENVHVTRPYLVTDFHNRPFRDPAMLEAAERLERLSAARSRGN